MEYALFALASQVDSEKVESLGANSEIALALLCLVAIIVLCSIAWTLLWRLPRALHDLIMSKLEKTLLETDLLKLELKTRREQARQAAQPGNKNTDTPVRAYAE